MAYIKKDRDGTFFVSFEPVDFDTSKLVATRISNEVGKFLKKTRKKTIEFRFGGYARMSDEFAQALCKNVDLRNNMERIITRLIHAFDQIKIAEALGN